MKRAVIFWHTLVVWTAVVFFQFAGKDKDMQSLNDVWTLYSK